MTVTRGNELSTTSLFSDANLIAYYKLENTADSKGTYTLSNVGTTTFAAAKFNNGIDLGTANTSKYMRVSSATGISSGSISVSMWVKINAEPATNTIYNLFSRGETASDVRHWIRYSDSASVKSIQFNRQRENVANDAVTYNVALGTTSWHHLALTYNAAHVKGYFDGTYVGSVASSGTGATGVFADNTTIGAGEITQGNSTPTLFSNAIIDDVAIFNRELTSTEVNSLLVYNVTYLDNVGVTDYIYRDSAYIRSNSDNLNITDSLVRASDVFLSITDSLVVITDDVLTTVVNIISIQQDSIGLTDSIIRTVDYSRNPQDLIGLTDLLDRTVTYTRDLTETLTLTDVLGAGLHFSITVIDTIGITESSNLSFITNEVNNPIIEFYQIDGIVPTIYNIIDG